MNQHLTHDQLSGLLLESTSAETSAGTTQPDEAAARHLRDCTLCAAELDNLRHAVALFRSSADAWANHHLAGSRPISLPLASAARRRSPFALAPALLAVAATVAVVI